jgi:hypothetical protein
LRLDALGALSQMFHGDATRAGSGAGDPGYKSGPACAFVVAGRAEPISPKREDSHLTVTTERNTGFAQQSHNCPQRATFVA